MRIVVGITGASGAQYAQRTIELLCKAGVDVHVAASDYGRRILAEELGMTRLDKATLSGGFEENRVSKFLGKLYDILFLYGLAESRDDRDSILFSKGACVDLVANFPDHFRRGADKFDSGLSARFRKVTVFGQESIPWVNGIRSALFGNVEDFVNSEVTFRCGSLSDEIRFLSLGYIVGPAIRFTVNGDRFEALFVASPDNPQSNFAPVGDENLPKGT